MTTVFNDLATALNGSRQFSFSADYTQNITAARQAFNDYTNDVDAGKEPQEAFNHILETGNDALIEYASQYGVTSKNLDTFIGNQAKAQVSLMAENTTLTNVSSLIHGYNNSVEATGLSQQEFASAVMATNGSLGQYLIGLNGAEASMRGYLGQVIATTAATVAMRAVTMALNAVIGMAISWLINKAIQAWDDYIHRVDNAKAALDEFEDKNKELVSDLDKQRKTIDNLSDSYFDLAKGVDSVTGKNVSLSADDYDKFVQMNGELADAFPELISHVDEYGNRFVDLGDDAVYAKKKLEEFYKQEEENYQYEQYKNLPEMFKNEQVVMDDIQGSVNELEADLARSTATLAQMQEAVNFTSGDMINVMAEYGDDAATAYAQAFRNTYVEAMNEAIADGDYDLANKLNDALLDTSTDGQYSFAVNLSNLGEEERKYLQKYFENFKGDYAEELNDSIADINKQLELKRKEYDSEWQRILPTLVGSAKYMATEETQDLAAAFVGSLSSDIYEEIKDRPIETVMREWLGDISKLSMDDRLKLESLLDTSLSPEERVRIYEELQASLNEKNLTLPVGLVIQDDKELVDRVAVSKARLSKTYSDRAAINAFFEEVGIDTREEYERWLDITKTTETATDAIKAYRDALKGIDNSLDNAKYEQYLGTLYEVSDALASGTKLTEEQLTALRAPLNDLVKQFPQLKDDVQILNEEFLQGTNVWADAIANIKKAITDLKLDELGDDFKNAAKEFNIPKTSRKLYAGGIAEARNEYNLAVKASDKYISNLDEIYKKYNGINNIDRDVIVWDDESLNKYRKFVSELYDGSFEDAVKDLKGTWSTVLGTSEEFDGIEIAYTQMLQTDHGLVPLTAAEFQKYFDSIFKQSWNEDGTFNAEKFIKLDSEGADQIINGQVEHVANMIAAAEGQYMNGIKLTADDVIAIGNPGYDDVTGEDLLPGISSIFKGFSMHEVQAEALESKHQLEELQDVAQETGHTLDEALNGVEIEISDEELTDFENRLNDLIESDKDISIAVHADISDNISTISDMFNDINTAAATVQKGFKVAFSDLEGLSAIFPGILEGMTILKDGSVQLNKEMAQAAIDAARAEADADAESAMDRLNTQATLLQQKADTYKEMAEAAAVLAGNEVDSAMTSEEAQAKLSAGLAEIKQINAQLTANEEQEQQKNVADSSKDNGQIVAKNWAGAWQDALNNAVDFANGAVQAQDNVTNKVKTGQLKVRGSSFTGSSGTSNETNLLAETKDALEENATNIQELYQDLQTRYLEAAAVAEKAANTAKDGIQLIKANRQFTDYNLDQVKSGKAGRTTPESLDTSKGGGDKEKKDDYKEFIDYFERLVKTLDNSIDLLEAHLQDVVGSFAKNTLLDAQEDLIKKKMDGYASAIGMYSQKASEALSKIPSEVAAKLQSGAVAIDEFVGESNKDVVDAIGDYEKWADKVADCKQQIVELREELRQLELQKFNNVVQDFTELFDRRQSAIDTISKAISLFEAASDKIVGRGFYDVSIDQTEKQLNHLNEERDALVAQMNSAIAAGINVAGDEWFEMLEVLEDLDGQILDSQKNIEDFKNAIISLYVEGFDRWNDRYTKQIELRTKAISALQKQISIIQESGNLTGEAYIQEQITQTQKQLSMLQHEREELVKRMSDATENGVRVGTDEWYSMVDALNSVDSAIQDCEESIESLDNAILALHTETFERIQNRFSSISDEISNMADMFSDFDVATKDNKWTSEGLAQLGLLGEQYELTKRRVEQYNEEIAELNKQYSDGKYSATEYAENLAQLRSAQWEQVKANKAALDSMIELNKARVDIVVEGINEETEAYAKLVEQEKETLSSEQDLHNYRKQIADANKSILEIQRQLTALEGDNSQTATAKRLKLEEELADAREELAEQEYEHSITSQQEALDQQLEDYQASRELEIEALQTTLDNEQQILTDTFAAIKENSFLIGQEILTMAQTLNITMSPEITAPWQSGENAIASYGALLNAESSNFILRLGEVESAEWRLQEQANSSSSAIANMFANQSDNLVSQTERANEQFRQEEQAAWSASNAIANAFGQRADGLVATIENARNSAQNLSAMSDALANSLSNSIDGAYSGASAQSALNGIADAANGVAEAARNAFNELSKLANAPKTTPKTTEHTIYGGYDGTGNYIGSRTATVSSDGTITIPKATKIKTYASGTKGVSKNQLAWTQEQGPEMIISPSSGAILTPLSKNDSVLPATQTDNIWDWSKFNPTEFAKQLIENMPSNGGNVQTNTMQVGALVQVNGNVNDTMEMMQIAATTATTKIKQSFNTLSNGLNK